MIENRWNRKGVRINPESILMYARSKLPELLDHPCISSLDRERVYKGKATVEACEMN
jgi:hypothetical protein